MIGIGELLPAYLTPLLAHFVFLECVVSRRGSLGGDVSYKHTPYVWPIFANIGPNIREYSRMFSGFRECW